MSADSIPVRSAKKIAEGIGWAGFGLLALLYYATVALVVGGIALGFADAAGIVDAGFLDSDEPKKQAGDGKDAGAAASDSQPLSGSHGFDRTPEKIDGSSSSEFEQEDLDQAAGASEEVREYCSGAVSEAQELGCLSHVQESNIP